MKMKRMKKALSCILCMVLIVAMALVTTGCSGNAGNSKVTSTTTAETVAASEAQEEAAVLGEGSKQFRFGVVDLEGKETWFEIHTDEEMVGAALLALNLIEGEEGPYGLYVKAVNGIPAFSLFAHIYLFKIRIDRQPGICFAESGIMAVVPLHGCPGIVS